MYLFKVNNRNTRERWEIRSKLTIKNSERRLQYPLKTFEKLWFSDVFRRVGGFFVVFLLLTGTYCKPFSSVSIVDSEQANVSWEALLFYIGTHSQDFHFT